MNQHRCFTFSENQLENLPKAVKEYLNELTKGVDYHYTKLYYQQQVIVSFPLAMGVPFLFKYNEPTLIHIQGKVKVHNEQENKQDKLFADIQKEIEFVYARNFDGRVGFYDSLGKNYASVGVENKLQINIPIKAHVQISSRNIKVHLAPLHPDQDATIMHYSVWPFSAQEKKDSHVPVSLNPNTKLVSDEYKKTNVDLKFGQQNTGMQFQLHGYTQSSDYKNIIAFLHEAGTWTRIMSPLKQKHIALTHYNLKYLGKQSQNKGVTLRAVYG